MNDATQTFVLGAGRIFFDAEDADGNLMGERYIGNTPGFEVTVESENVDLWDSDGPVAQKVEDVTTQVTRNTTITCNNISDANLAMFVVGELADVVSAAGAVTDEEIGDVQAGLHYQLGKPVSPTGVREVTDVVLTDGASTEFVLDTDYELDAALGRFYVIPGGAMDGEIVFADYNTTEGARSQVITGSMASVNGALRFIADNTRGRNRDLYAPRVQLRPDGALAFKSRDTWMEMQFSAELLQRGALGALYIDGRQVASAT